jgi:single-stranded-DNA-specific exonuclease
MPVAVDRVRQAIARGESIVVYGDFDVDGVAAAALMVQVIRDLGGHVEVYIPKRLEEGYGLNRPAMEHLADQGVGLVITVDCGTSSVSEVGIARDRGLDIIITDHHHVPSTLPPAIAVVNPKREGSKYPFHDLAGVGVAYRLAEALTGPDHPLLSRVVDLVALGTVVDVAPLVGENRTLVRCGLEAINRMERPGLVALCQEAGIAPDRVDAWVLGYVIGPRLNASGRLGDAFLSYSLLVTEDMGEARCLAESLGALNSQRQHLTEEGLEWARREAAAQAQHSPLIFVAGPDDNAGPDVRSSSKGIGAGIIGLIAGRLAEEFYRPTVVVAVGEKLSRGSCRSIPEFHMAEALGACGDLLVRFGGHAQAAGFTVETAKLDALHVRLREIAHQRLAGYDLRPTICVDARLPLSRATWETIRWLDLLQPFGEGNSPPVFLSEGVRVRDVRRTDGGDHLRLLLAGDGQQVIDAIGFHLGDWAESVRPGDRVDIAYTLERTIWGGEPMIQIVLQAIAPASR